MAKAKSTTKKRPDGEQLAPKPSAATTASSSSERPRYRAVYVVRAGGRDYHAGDEIVEIEPGEAKRQLALGAIQLIE